MASQAIIGQTQEQFAKRLDGRAVTRPQDDPPHGIPIALRSAQHSQISRGRFEPPWSKRIVLANWLIKGEALMGVGGRRVPIRPGDFALYLPSMPHQLWAVSKVVEMCWFSIDGPLAEPFVLQLNLPAGVYPFGAAPLTVIDTMMDSLSDHTIQGRRRASLLAIQAWYNIANTIRAPEVHSAISQARHLIEQEFSNPDTSVNQVATRLGYHRASLSRMFHKSTGVTLKDYLAQVRLQEAQSLLLHSDFKIADISRKCGFPEVSYFCRWLRNHTGQTPSQIRESAAP